MELYSCIGSGGGLLPDSAKPLPEPIKMINWMFKSVRSRSSTMPIGQLEIANPFPGIQWADL